VDDPVCYKQAIAHQNSDKWIEAMQDELKSMSTNQVYELVEIPNGVKLVGYKWVYKTKCDSKGKFEKFKATLLANFTQVEGVDDNETFSPVSTKDSFRIIMVLVAYFDLELHRMDVKTAFLKRWMIHYPSTLC